MLSTDQPPNPIYLLQSLIQFALIPDTSINLMFSDSHYSATETTEEEDLGVSTTSWRAFRDLYPCICDLIRNFFMSLCSLWPLWQNA